MSNITDELSREELNKLTSAAPKAAEKTVQGVKKGIEGGTKVVKATVKGVCLIINGGKFTTEAVMKAVTGDVKYSHRNIPISKLMKSDTVKKIDAAQTAEVMKYFDKYCKQCGVKYSAIKDNKDSANPVYMVFYEGKQAAIIDYVFKKASADYLKDKSQSKQRDKQAEKTPERESVRAKLAFFRSRTESEKQDVKSHQHEHQKDRADRQAR